MRRGVWFVLFYHFAGYTRVIGPTAAGLLRMPYHRWAMADYGGAVLWILGYFSIGYALGVLGLSLDSTDRWFRIGEWVLLRRHRDLGADDAQNALRVFRKRD